MGNPKAHLKVVYLLPTCHHQKLERIESRSTLASLERYWRWSSSRTGLPVLMPLCNFLYLPSFLPYFFLHCYYLFVLHLHFFSILCILSSGLSIHVVVAFCKLFMGVSWNVSVSSSFMNWFFLFLVSTPPFHLRISHGLLYYLFLGDREEGKYRTKEKR